jgi:uncharacterized phage protein (TIGR01671 family)
MREIKFRGWNPEVSKMLYNVAVSNNCFVHPEQTSGSDSWDAKLVESKEIILMQYTGLKDKNGKEIYEGDIIFDGVSNQIVKFNDAFIDIKHGHGECYYNCSIFLFSNYGKGDEIEIIGNIYENPELMERINENDN